MPHIHFRANMEYNIEETYIENIIESGEDDYSKQLIAKD